MPPLVSHAPSIFLFLGSSLPVQSPYLSQMFTTPLRWPITIVALLILMPSFSPSQYLSLIILCNSFSSPPSKPRCHFSLHYSTLVYTATPHATKPVGLPPIYFPSSLSNFFRVSLILFWPLSLISLFVLQPLCVTDAQATQPPRTMLNEPHHIIWNE